MRVNSLPPPSCQKCHAPNKKHKQKQLKFNKTKIYFMFNNLCKRKTLEQTNPLLTLKIAKVNEK